jgi:uncharacterized membrane protein
LAIESSKSILHGQKKKAAGVVLAVTAVAVVDLVVTRVDPVVAAAVEIAAATAAALDGIRIFFKKKVGEE